MGIMNPDLPNNRSSGIPEKNKQTKDHNQNAHPVHPQDNSDIIIGLSQGPSQTQIQNQPTETYPTQKQSEGYNLSVVPPLALTQGTGQIEQQISMLKSKLHIPKKIYPKARGSMERATEVEVNCLPLSLDKFFKNVVYQIYVEITPDLPKRLIRNTVEEFNNKHYPKVNFAFDGQAYLYTTTKIKERSDLVSIFNEKNNRTIVYTIVTKVVNTIQMNKIKDYFKFGSSNSLPTDAIQSLYILLKNQPIPSRFEIKNAIKGNQSMSIVHFFRNIWNNIIKNPNLPCLRVGIDDKKIAIPFEEIKQNTEVWKDDGFFKCVKINKWVVLNLDMRISIQKIKNFEQHLINSGKKLNVVVSPMDPVINEFSTMDFSLQEFRTLIDDLFTKLKACNTELIVVVIQNHSPKIYAIIKDKSDLEIGIPTQCVTTTSMLTMAPVISTKMLQKIISKLNEINRTLVTKNSSPCMEDAIIFGGDTAHPPINNNFTPSVAAKIKPKADDGFFKCVNINKWVVLNLDMEISIQRIINFERLLIKSGKKLDVVVSPMDRVINEFSTMDFSSQEFKTSIDDIFTKLKACNTELIVVVFQTHSLEIYATIEEKSVIFGVATQCITAGTLLKMSPTISTTILRKIKSKLNEINHALVTRNSSPCMEDAIIIGGDMACPPIDNNLTPSVPAEIKHNAGEWRDRFFKCVNINKWVVLNLDMNNSIQKIINFEELLINSGKKLNVVVSPMDPVIYEFSAMDFSLQEFKTSIDDLLTKLKACNTELIVVLLPNNSPEIYDAIKEKSDLEFGVPTQCVTAITMLKMSPTISTNILRKIKLKLNEINHTLVTKNSSPCMEDAIIFGDDTAHPPINNNFTPSVAALCTVPCKPSYCKNLFEK